MACYKYKNRVRYFYSKGLFLVLFWTTLFSVTGFSFIKLYNILLKSVTQPYHHYALMPFVPFLFFAPLLGWLADSWLGNMKVFKLGSFLIFLGAVAACICTVIVDKVPIDSATSHILCYGVSPVIFGVAYIGMFACCITALQLGLDQMPDASSSNVTSFITWFIASIFVGLWTTSFFHNFIQYCNLTSLYGLDQYYSLIPVVSSSLLLTTIFLLAPKWLIIEPKSPQFLKTIYQVLKFTWKHKAPLNRSALTYWEENVPSRMDLGKTRFGGPFTTEQVEDVKSFLKVSLVMIPLCFNSLITRPALFKEIEPTINLLDLGRCTSYMTYAFTYNPWWCPIVVIFLYEFILYPLIRYKLPSMLKRIGIIYFIVALVNIGFLILHIMESHYHFYLNWEVTVYWCYAAVTALFFIRAILEFVCAQSPYSMRCLLSGYAVVLQIFSCSGAVIFLTLNKVSNGHIIASSLVAAQSLTGFIGYCVIARWYKMRVRDEGQVPRSVVEDIYERYISYYAHS